VKEGGSNGAPDLAASYATAFTAYLTDRGERELGAAYDLGRQAVAAHLSVLDLAEAHHAAVRAALGGGSPPETTLQAAAAFLRESLSIFESVHRGYSEVREVARIEHEHVGPLRALTDASVALNSSLTVEEILQLTADAACALIGGTRATVAIYAPDPRLRPLTATSPPRLSESELEPARLSVLLTARGRELGMVELVDRREREFTARDETILTQLAQLASVAISNAQLYERERTIAQTLQRSLRPGGLPDVPGLSAAVRFRPAGEGVELGGDFYDVIPVGHGHYLLVGDVAGHGAEVAAYTAQIRHTVRALAPFSTEPAQIVERVNSVLVETETGERFATLQLALLESTESGGIDVELASAAHPPAVIVRADGSTECLSGGSIVGVWRDVDIGVDRFALEPGETLLVYTDGWLEAGPVESHRTPDELAEAMAASSGEDLEDLLDRLRTDAVMRAGTELKDDLVLLAVRPTGPREPAPA
jgi:serine phosphatase RsbU (regulator of sigma subunit)